MQQESIVEKATDVARDGLILTESKSYFYTTAQLGTSFHFSCLSCKFLGSTVHAPTGVVVFVTRVYRQCPRCASDF